MEEPIEANNGIPPQTQDSSACEPRGFLGDQDSAELSSLIRQKLATIPGLGALQHNAQSELIDHLVTTVSRLSIQNKLLQDRLATLDGRTTLTDDGHTATGGRRSPQPSTSDPPLEAASQDGEHGHQSRQDDMDLSEITITRIHVVYCDDDKACYFKDTPRMFKGDLVSEAHLRGKRGILNIANLMDKNPHFALAVVNMHACWCDDGPDHRILAGHIGGRLIRDSPIVPSEKIYVQLNKATGAALDSIISRNPARFSGLSRVSARGYVHEPFIPFYVHNKTFASLASASELSREDQRRVELVCGWFEDNYRKVWDEADEQLSRGKISLRHRYMLFKPGELLVQRPLQTRDWCYRVWKVKNYPWKDVEERSADIETWEFHGGFFSHDFTFNHSNSYQFRTDADVDLEVDITSLEVYPLRFATPGLYEKMVSRGRKLWGYRNGRLVAYNDPHEPLGPGFKDVIENRFMIDYSTFRKLYPGHVAFKIPEGSLISEPMMEEEPPNDILAMMPAQVWAFQLSTKKWEYILVEHLSDVVWSKDVFKRVVLPAETKEFIQAAVSVHGSHMNTAPDLVAGKGRGLLILLHGSPGTGKTLTAESIAEMQERPLYRVSCGDIGIDPIAVEKYLNDVLIKGKAWGCVVLLDEADVFLEARSVSDQKQNAVVSVFLRQLEYYDGIMLLTTNRVGTFDEAFKSRIHLALYYPKLDELQRAEIWSNFIQMLRPGPGAGGGGSSSSSASASASASSPTAPKERVDMEDLERNVVKLAQADLNGRQIRNVLTMARYLAGFRKQVLTYRHVQDALASAVKFDEYLHGVRGGSDEEFAKDERLR